MILLIDNYDSFVYNLARYLAELGCETQVVRNDALDVAAIRKCEPQAIVLSPGPCTPRESGICPEVVRELGPQIPLLGVCLGHQAIAHALGGRIGQAREPMHGRTSLVHHDQCSLFEGLPNPFPATRYHSLVIEEDALPPDLMVTARCPQGVVMAIQHRRWPVFGVQVHPESVLTQGGHRLLGNFLTIAGIPWRAPTRDDFYPPATKDDFYSRPISRGNPLTPGDPIQGVADVQ